MTVHRAYHAGCSLVAQCGMDRRALALWPGLDRRSLARCRHDPDRISALVARRTRLAPDVIRSLLNLPTVTAEDAATWFG